MATSHETIVVGVFPILRLAQQAVQELEAAGFGPEEFGLASHHIQVTQLDSPELADGTKADEGALGGVLAGAGVGSLWGLGVAAEVLPEIGPLLACGLFTSVSATAIAGATAGAVVGTMIGAGMPGHKTRHQNDELHSRRTLVTVHTDGRFEKVCSILRCNGAKISFSS